MLNKIALGGLLLTSSLALTSVAMAGFEDNGDTLKISVRKLQSGSKYGEIFVQGKKCTVSNLTPASWGTLQGLKKEDKLTAVKKDGSFYFSHTQGGGLGTKYNEESKQWEDEPLPGVIVFDLKVTPLSEKTTVETIEINNNVMPLTTALSNLKLEPKEEIKEEKPPIPSSVTISPVEMVEFDYSGQNLVLTAEQLEKGFQEGKLVTNHGTFSVAPAFQYASNTFTMIEDKQQKFTGYVSGGQFYFSHMQGGGFGTKYNEETKQWDEEALPGSTVFDLIVKKMDK